MKKSFSSRASEEERSEVVNFYVFDVSEQRSKGDVIKAITVFFLTSCAYWCFAENAFI